MLILISWLHQKPADLNLQCYQKDKKFNPGGSAGLWLRLTITGFFFEISVCNKDANIHKCYAYMYINLYIKHIWFLYINSTGQRLKSNIWWGEQSIVITNSVADGDSATTRHNDVDTSHEKRAHIRCGWGSSRSAGALHLSRQVSDTSLVYSSSNCMYLYMLCFKFACPSSDGWAEPWSDSLFSIYIHGIHLCKQGRL